MVGCASCTVAVTFMCVKGGANVGLWMWLCGVVSGWKWGGEDLEGQLEHKRKKGDRDGGEVPQELALHLTALVPLSANERYY